MFLKFLVSGGLGVGGLVVLAGLHLPPQGCPLSRLLATTCGAAVAADDAPSDKPAFAGKWGKKQGELIIDFADKDVLKIAPHGDSALIAIVCDYTVEKEGLVKVKVTGLEGQEEITKKVQEHVPVGLEFNFKWKATGNAARLEDVKSGNNIDMLKSHLEGDFEKKQ